SQRLGECWRAVGPTVIDKVESATGISVEVGEPGFWIEPAGLVVGGHDHDRHWWRRVAVHGGTGRSRSHSRRIESRDTRSKRSGLPTADALVTSHTGRPAYSAMSSESRACRSRTYTLPSPRTSMNGG